MKIYLAANYSMHPEMRTVAQILTDNGHEVTSEWINGTHGGDDRAEYARIDLRDVDAADALVFFSEMPAGSRMRGGKHVEFGYALAKGKRLFVVGKLQNVFHNLPSVIQRHEFADLLPVLNSISETPEQQLDRLTKIITDSGMTAQEFARALSGPEGDVIADAKRGRK